MRQDIRFSDLDASFKVNPNTRDLVTKKNSDAIKQHVKLLFMSGLLFRPDTDPAIPSILFERWNAHSESTVHSIMMQHLERFEPRIDILTLEIKFAHPERKLQVRLRYSISGLEEEINFSLMIQSVR